MKVDSGMGPLSGPPAVPHRGAPRRSGRFRVPTLPAALVERHRLLDMLSDAVDSAPLTVLSAPAGSGKTVLVSHWARSARPPLGWMTASERDSDPRAFWSHVWSALAEGDAVRIGARGELVDRAESAVDADEADDPDLLADQLLRLGRTVVLVIDAADRLVGKEVFAGLAALVDGADGLLRVVMTTRQEPPMPLHRFRLEGTVAELGQDDLAFTSGELTTLLEVHHLDASDQTVRDVLVQTEGWAAGARMAALALQPDGDGSTLERFAGEYLAAEVLDSLSEAEEDVLLSVAVVEEVSPDLAAALSGQRNAEACLRDLARRNAFVQVVRSRPGHHRLHPLLRILLDARRRATGESREDELHRIASDWFGAAGQLVPAVDHAVSARDWERAAAWTVRLDGLAGLLLRAPQGAAVADRLTGMPAGGSPEITVVRAAMALAQGDVDRAREHLAQEYPAPRHVGERPSSERRSGGLPAHYSEAEDSGRVWAAVLAARLGELAGDDEATLAAADRAHSLLATIAEDSTPGLASVTALARCSEGTAYAHAGRLQEASVALEAAVSAAAEGGRGDLTLRCMSMLSLAEACLGRLTRAQEVADAADQVADRVSDQIAERSAEQIAKHAAGSGVERSGAPAPPPALELARAWVSLERQDLPRAAHALARVGQLTDGVDPPLLQWVSLLLRVRLKRDHGDGVGARRLLQGVDSRVGWLRDAFDEEAAAVGLLASVAELHPDRGTPASGLDEPDSRTVAATPQVNAMLESARIDWLRGDQRASRSTVAAALARAQGEQRRRPFTHASPEIRALLRDDPALRSQANWLRPNHTTTSQDRRRRRERAPVVEDLSERELEVLRHLSDLLTTEEIAAEMFISANTVRTHIRRILGKLSVSRRHEAVRRARELDLV
ncbi:LuxR family transcriptional regulator [Intrasporangium mesophilum]